MPYFSLISLRRLKTCHPHLQYVLMAAIERFDFTVLCGHRTEQEQNEAFNNKKSKVQYPNSKHNVFPSLAVDIAPYFADLPHIRWNRKNEFILLAGICIGIADEKRIKLRWGGNWDQDNEIITDQTFIDLPHLELIL